LSYQNQQRGLIFEQNSQSAVAALLVLIPIDKRARAFLRIKNPRINVSEATKTKAKTSEKAHCMSNK